MSQEKIRAALDALAKNDEQLRDFLRRVEGDQSLAERPSVQSLLETLSVYRKMKQEIEPYEIEVLGKGLTVLPNVFSPKYFTDSEWFAREIPQIVADSSFLEIGTGTGIVTMFVGHGVATDINPDAVKNAQMNFSRHNLAIPVLQGNLFDPLGSDQKFDFIFWNHPFNQTTVETSDVLLRAGLDHDYKGLDGFFRGGQSHLTPQGRLLLGTGSIANIQEIERLSHLHGYGMHLLRSKELPFECGSDVQIDLRIYEHVFNDGI